MTNPRETFFIFGKIGFLSLMDQLKKFIRSMIPFYIKCLWEKGGNENV